MDERTGRTIPLDILTEMGYTSLMETTDPLDAIRAISFSNVTGHPLTIHTIDGKIVTGTVEACAPGSDVDVPEGEAAPVTPTLCVFLGDDMVRLCDIALVVT